MNEDHISVWRALYGWIDQPRKTLRHVIQDPRWPLWLAPALAIVIALIVVTVVSAPSASELARVQAEQQLEAQMGSISGEQAEQVERTLETFTSPLFIAATGITMGILGLIVTWLFRGGVLFFISYLFGTDSRYVQAVTLVLWSWLPFALRDLLNTAYVVVSGQMVLNRGLSFLVSSGNQIQDAGNLLYGFLSLVDPFVAWHLALVAIGLAVVTRTTTLKVAIGTVGYWVLTAVVGLAPTLLSMLTSSAL